MPRGGSSCCIFIYFLSEGQLSWVRFGVPQAGSARNKHVHPCRSVSCVTHSCVCTSWCFYCASERWELLFYVGGSCYAYKWRFSVWLLGYSIYDNGSPTVPVARCNACEMAWHTWEQPVVAVCGVVLVAAIVLLLPAGTYRRYLRDQ